jgi:predicted PurR-regulated permease PerM
MYTIILLICIKIFVCLFIIYLFHSIWTYLKDTYSTKKTKDLVNTQIDKYKKIIHELQENKGIQEQPSISEKDLESMDQDLTNFMQNEL